MGVLQVVAFVILAGLYGVMWWLVFVHPPDEIDSMPADQRWRDEWRRTDREL